MRQGIPRKFAHGIPTFYGVYENFKEEVMTYGGRSWGRQTIRQYDATVLNHVIPYLKDHDRRHIGQISRQDYDDALSKLKENGKNAPGEPFEAWDENGIPEKVDYLMRAVVFTAHNHFLCENVFGDRIIDRTGGGTTKTGIQHVRTKKSLSVKQEIAVAKYLNARLYEMNPTAGLLLMYALGLRNNEATGVNFGYIREFTEYPGHYFMIVPQSTELGAKTLKILGKTANSGRKVPLPRLIVELLVVLREIRIRQARARGYEGREEDLPIACNKMPWERCSADDLSNAAREMFLSIGMRENQFVELNQELLEDAQAARDEMEEDEFREIESDPTAYLLRRNFATHMAVLGLRDVEIWYVIGHKIEDEYVQRRAFNDEKLLFALKRKMDERPIINEVKAEHSVQLVPGKTVSLDSYKKVVIEIPVEQIARIQIAVEAKEPGDEIKACIRSENCEGAIHSTFSAYGKMVQEKLERTIDGTRFYQKAFTDADRKG